MTQDDIRALQEIKGTHGYEVIIHLAELRLEELRNVESIDEHTPNLEARTIGRKLAVKEYKDFINEISLSTPSGRETKRTYE